jgi:prepilin-type N-terminal cleavage/methylation domain-containing protein
MPINMKKGFTLIELLIVIAIIGILTSIVIGSTNISRAKARDSKRISDMKEIQLGLALYYDVNKAYPSDLASLVTDRYLPVIPTDPDALRSYEYLLVAGRYCLGVTLEDIIPPDGATCTSAVSNSTANYKAASR